MAGVGVLLQRLFPRRVLSLPLTHVVWGERRLQTDPSHLAMANHSLAVLRVFEVQVREPGFGLARGAKGWVCDSVIRRHRLHNVRSADVKTEYTWS